jgi:hypothetical protein
VKLLILGASDSEGTLLANFADSWREQLRTRLPALIGEDVEVDHRRFYVHIGDSLAYVERCLAEAQPDFVIMGCTGYAFSTSSVGNRLRRRLGKRFGDWAERRSAAFDRATERELGSARERINYAAHWVAGKTIGREAVANYASVLSAYERCIDALARREDLDAIIMGSTYNGPRVQRRLPYIRSLVDRFNRDLKAMADAHRFGWLDRQAIISALPAEIARPDQMHTGPEIHAAYAEALLPLVAARVGTKPGLPS